MKRILPLLLIAALLFSACSMSGERLREPVTFYYLHAHPEQLRPEETLFVGEVREAAGHRHDLSYLMALYLIGPTGEDLTSPLSRGTRILSVSTEEDTILLQLLETGKPMTDIEYTLACTCLSMTCMGLTSAENVTITCGERSITMSRDTLVLGDHTADNTMEDVS